MIYFPSKDLQSRNRKQTQATSVPERCIVNIICSLFCFHFIFSYRDHKVLNNFVTNSKFQLDRIFCLKFQSPGNISKLSFLLIQRCHPTHSYFPSTIYAFEYQIHIPSARIHEWRKFPHRIGDSSCSKHYVIRNYAWTIWKADSLMNVFKIIVFGRT